MEEIKQHPDEIVRDIKQMMERSSRFISLSGLSGIAAGICALGGAWIANNMLEPIQETTNYSGYFRLSAPEDALTLKLLGLAVATFTLAFISAFYLTWRKAKNKTFLSGIILHEDYSGIWSFLWLPEGFSSLAWCNMVSGVLLHPVPLFFMGWHL